MSNGKPERPWPLQFIPDVRVWIVIAYFVLGWRLLYMIEANPKLLQDGAFMLVVGLVIGSGGLGAITAYYFGGTKVGGEVMASQTATIGKSASATLETSKNGSPTPVTVVATPEAPLPVHETEPQPATPQQPQ